MLGLEGFKKFIFRFVCRSEEQFMGADFTMWSPGIKLRLSGWLAVPFPGHPVGLAFSCLLGFALESGLCVCWAGACSEV